MISKNDCMSILVKLGDEGLEVNGYIKKLLISKEVPIEVLRFISQNRGIEISNFYEMLRKRHNQNKSPLYTNILREVEEPIEVVTTLNCLLTQILLYSKKIDKVEDFYKAARSEEISRALHNYFETADISICTKLLELIKSDILVLEYIAGRRDLQ